VTSQYTLSALEALPNMGKMMTVRCVNGAWSSFDLSAFLMLEDSEVSFLLSVRIFGRNQMCPLLIKLIKMSLDRTLLIIYHQRHVLAV